MAPPSVAVIDTLNSLLEAECNSIFHFVGQDSPYLKTATPDVRSQLETIRNHLDRHEREIGHLIRRLGGSPSTPPTPDPSDQYLTFLSLKFLIPKLVEAKNLMIERYDHALQSLDGDPEVRDLLNKHIAEMRDDLAVLDRLSAQVNGRG